MLLSLIQCCFHCGSIFIIDLLAVKFLQEFSEVYNENQVLPILPSTTKWTSHGRAFKALYEGYQAHIGALTVCYKKRKEPKRLGIFLAITLEIFIASLPTLRNVFKAIAPLNLVVQAGNEQLCLADVKTYNHLTRSNWEICGLVKRSGSRRKISMIWSAKHNSKG